VDDLGDEEAGQHVGQGGDEGPGAPRAGGAQEGVGEGPGQVEAQQAQGHQGRRRGQEAEEHQVRGIEGAGFAVGEEGIAPEQAGLPDREAPLA
jgi:hypothetical protein